MAECTEGRVDVLIWVLVGAPVSIASEKCKRSSRSDGVGVEGSVCMALGLGSKLQAS